MGEVRDNVFSTKLNLSTQAVNYSPRAADTIHLKTVRINGILSLTTVNGGLKVMI